MSTLIEQIEAMRIRMNELATEEHGLVRTLGDALAGADQRLLEEVRSIATAHEARRSGILRELQALAGRMCVLHRPQEPLAALNANSQETPARDTERVADHADLRLPAANLQHELASYLRIRGR